MMRKDLRQEDSLEGFLKIILVQNRNLTAETPWTQRSHFLFGGERPPNKKPFFAPEKGPFAARERSNAI